MANRSLETVTPTPLLDVAGDGRWLSQHNRFIQETLAQRPEILFVGDSILQQLQDSDIWQELFAPLGVLNFSIGGDTTQQLLWRLSNGELENIKPKVIVLLIGTNNFLYSAEDTANGIKAVVDLITKFQSEAQLFVLELLPRGEKPNPQRVRIQLINQLLHEQFKAYPNVRVVSLDPGFVGKDGLISAHDMPDYLHLTNAAYTKAFSHLYDIVSSSLTSAEIKKMHHNHTHA